MIKRLYNMLALLAIINLFAVGGLVGYLFASGRLNAERVDQVAVVLRGEFPDTSASTTQPVLAKEVPVRSREEIANMQAQRRFWSLVSERHQREVEDRQSVNRSIQLEAQRLLEQIDDREKQFEQQKQKFMAKTQQDGFEQALEMYLSLEPKLARDLLKEKKDADVVQLMMQMDPRARKKIMNSCKSKDELAWIGRILEAIQTLNRQQASAGSAGSGGS